MRKTLSTRGGMNSHFWGDFIVIS